MRLKSVIWRVRAIRMKYAAEKWQIVFMMVKSLKLKITERIYFRIEFLITLQITDLVSHLN